MFFDSWEGIWRTFIIGILSYLALVLLLRVSGKRTLSKMNAFDLVVTIAIGSTLATIILSKGVSLAEGIMALTLLVFLQYAITWLSVRYRFFSRIIKAEPKLVFYQGSFLDDVLKSERIMKDEVLQAIRNQGKAYLEEVSAVVLETDGSFSIITRSKTDISRNFSTLKM